MSGLTPLIDTLLHHVLGKRVDLPLPRTSTEPVSAVNESTPVRTMHSDSRLDPRPREVNDAIGQRRPATAPATGGGSAAPAQPAGASARAAADVQMSPVGRLITALMSGDSTAVQPLTSSRPLAAAGDSPEILAGRLNTTVRDSGLFYESHLGRWFRGELPTAQLQREPQMRWAQARAALLPAPATGGSAVPAVAVGPPVPDRVAPSVRGQGLTSGPVADASSNPNPPGPASMPAAQAPVAPGTGAAQAVAAAAAGDAAVPPGQREPAAPAAMPQELQGLVRQQLEMLAGPALRWEGEVWQGLFMHLDIRPAVEDGYPDRERQAADDGAGADDGAAWDTRLQVSLPSLGEIDIQLRLRSSGVALAMVAEESACAGLEAHRDTLLERLASRGLPESGLSIQPRTGQRDAG